MGRLSKINGLFRLTSLPNATFLVSTPVWVFKRVSLFGLNLNWIKVLGTDVSLFVDEEKAKDFIKSRKKEYVTGRRIIKF